MFFYIIDKLDLPSMYTEEAIAFDELVAPTWVQVMRMDGTTSLFSCQKPKTRNMFSGGQIFETSKRRHPVLRIRTLGFSISGDLWTVRSDKGSPRRIKVPVMDGIYHPNNCANQRARRGLQILSWPRWRLQSRKEKHG